MTPIASPVCNGRYLVLPSATGVTVYSSTPAADGTDTIATPGQPLWGYEFGAGQGIAGSWVPTANWYTAATPVLSDGVVVVPLTNNPVATGELRANGTILVLRLTS